jgi:hypothetical protein
MSMYHQRRERTTGGQWSAWTTFEAYGPASDCLDMTNAGVVAVRHGDTEIEYRQVPPEPTPAEALEALGLDPQGRPKDAGYRFRITAEPLARWNGNVEDLPPAPERKQATNEHAIRCGLSVRKAIWAAGDTSLTEADIERIASILGLSLTTPVERIREALAVLDRVGALELPRPAVSRLNTYAHGYHDGQRSLYRQITSNERDRA